MCASAGRSDDQRYHIKRHRYARLLQFNWAKFVGTCLIKSHHIAIDRLSIGYAIDGANALADARPLHMRSIETREIGNLCRLTIDNNLHNEWHASISLLNEPTMYVGQLHAHTRKSRRSCNKGKEPHYFTNSFDQHDSFSPVLRALG